MTEGGRGRGGGELIALYKACTCLEIPSKVNEKRTNLQIPAPKVNLFYHYVLLPHS